MKRCPGSGMPARRTAGMAGTCRTCGLVVKLRAAIINPDRFVLCDHRDLRKVKPWTQLDLPLTGGTP